MSSSSKNHPVACAQWQCVAGEDFVQLVALAFGNHTRRPTRHRALNGLTDKTAVAHLGHGNFVDVAATLRTNLNQAVFRQFNKGF